MFEKGGRSAMLLLVEDEALIAMAEVARLETYGYEVLLALSGEEAVELFRSNEGIDLVLMDIDLGTGIDGTQAGALLLGIREVPILYLSSHSEPEIVAKTEKITSYGYVTKNSSITVLDASIKMAFRLFEANRKVVASSRALFDKNQLLENILDHFPGSVFWKDLHSVYVGCNVTEAATAGLSSPAEIVGKTDFELGWLEGEAEFFRSSDRAVMESGKPLYGIEEEHDFGGGKVLWNETSKIPLRDGAGNMIGIVGISVDITKRKLVEERLRRCEELLRTGSGGDGGGRGNGCDGGGGGGGDGNGGGRGVGGGVDGVGVAGKR